MRKQSWLPPKPKPQPKPKVDDLVRETIDLQVVSVVAKLKKRYCKSPHNPTFNWPDDLFTRWHRDALYFVVVMRKPHKRPPSFEARVARMEHIGDGKFNLAIPMRRGWNTIMKDAMPEECLNEVSEYISF